MENARFQGKEKRSSSRLNLGVSCTLTFEDGLDIPVELSNISTTGAFVCFDHDDKDSFVNMRVWVDFSMDIKHKQYDMKVSGTVVRATPAGMGLSFRLSEREKIEPVMDLLSEDLELRHLTEHAGSLYER